jgi:mono/diheme cytochrome c family protein
LLKLYSNRMNLLARFGLMALGAAALAARADQPVSFTNEIAPIFVQKCLSCHGPDKNKGGYRLDGYEALMKPGGSKEPSITPGEPKRSKLFQLITAKDEDDRMPQKNEPLSSGDIGRIERWIKEGAHFDGPDGKAALVAIIPAIAQPDPPAVYSRPAPVTALAFSPGGTELAASGYHEITLWNASNGVLVRRIKNVAQRTLSLAYQPHGRLLAAASGTPGRLGEVKLFDPATGALVKGIATSADTMLTVAFSPDGAKLACGGSDNAIRIFDVASGKPERVIEQHADWVMGLAYSHNGELLASASRDKSARLYDAESGEMAHSYFGHGEFVLGVAFSADDQRVFSCGRDRKVHIWSAGEITKDAKGKGKKEKERDKLGEISGFDGDVLKVLVSSNWVFTCSADQSVRQYSAGKSPELVRSYTNHADVVYAMAFDEKSGRVATGGFDGKVRIFNAANGELVVSFTAAPGIGIVGSR